MTPEFRNWVFRLELANLDCPFLKALQKLFIILEVYTYYMDGVRLQSTVSSVNIYPNLTLSILPFLTFPNVG